jgi:hypothetical protein
MNTHRFDLSLFSSDRLRKDYFDGLDKLIPDDRTKDFNDNYLVIFDMTENVDLNKHYCHGELIKTNSDKTFKLEETVWFDINNCRGFKLKDQFGAPYVCPWMVVHKDNIFITDPGPKVIKNAPEKTDIEKKKPKLNLDPSLKNYMAANDFLKSMFTSNPNKTLRVLKKIYLPIMIEGKMLEIADTEEEFKLLKAAYKKLDNKEYRPDLKTDIFAKMRAACEETGASFEKLKALNGAKGGYSKAAKGKFIEK